MHCAACHAATSEARRYLVAENMLGTGEVFHYEPCGDCGSSTIVDPPADLDRYYPPTYEAFSRRQGVTAAVRRRFGLDDRWRAMRRVAPSVDARVLDVGCGSGDFLRTLEAQGFRDLTGVDPFLPFEPRRHGACRFLRGDVSQLRGDRYDVVTMHHVIEHAADPQRLLRDAAAVLAPDGVMLVRAPLLDSWAARTYGARWVQHDAPRHLVLLTSLGMARVAEAAGLRIVENWRDEGWWHAWAGATLAAGGDPFRRLRLAARISRHRYGPAARRRNRAGTGDQGCFVLRHAG